MSIEMERSDSGYRSGKGACGQAAALRGGGRRCAPTALWCSVSWPRRRTHYVRFAHCVQTNVAESVVDARWRARATSPALLGASEARRSLPARAFADASAGLLADTTTRHQAPDLITYARRLLEGVGMDASIATDLADILVEADLMGHDTHGLQLLAGYLGEIEKGGMTRSGTHEVLNERGATALWDG